MASSDRARFINRLGYYLMGVAIGLVLLGFFWQAKREAVRQQQQQQHTPPPARPTP